MWQELSKDQRTLQAEGTAQETGRRLCSGVRATRRRGAWPGRGRDVRRTLPGAPKPAVSPEFWPHCVFLPAGRAVVFALAGAGAGGPSPPSFSQEVLAGTGGSMQQAWFASTHRSSRRAAPPGPGL